MNSVQKLTFSTPQQIVLLCLPRLIILGFTANMPRTLLQLIIILLSFYLIEVLLNPWVVFFSVFM